MGVESDLSEKPLSLRGLSFRRRPSGYASPRLLISFIPIESKESLTKHNKNFSGLTLVKPALKRYELGTPLYGTGSVCCHPLTSVLAAEGSSRALPWYSPLAPLLPRCPRSPGDMAPS